MPKIYKCDALCIRYMNKDCITEDEDGDGNCDRPDEYREVGDVADSLKQEHEDRLWEGSESNPKNRGGKKQRE